MSRDNKIVNLFQFKTLVNNVVRHIALKFKVEKWSVFHFYKNEKKVRNLLV
jgi:hypothetical protein